MFGFSGEHILILGIILLIFGPKRLPGLGAKLGKSLKNFKDGLNGVQDANFRHVDTENTQKLDEKEKKDENQPQS